jgi:ring-1,2-phenylacetyl-CoA epoxidase subunit PaaB
MPKNMADPQAGDTQWPAYLVFQQKEPHRPHQHAGSVHAPDAEMALMNARDVFVRRPPCISLWVSPERAVYARTLQELEEGAGIERLDLEQGAHLEPYAVFVKIRQKESCVYRGRLDSDSPAGALALALDLFADPEALWWWVIPEREISRTEIGDQDSLFEPANRKVFRHQSSFNTLTLMRQIASESSSIPEEDDVDRQP